MRVKRTDRIVITLVTVLLLVLTAACAPTPEEVTPAPTPTLPAGMGMIEIQVIDPPPPGVASANVTLTKMEVHKAVGEDGEWITIIGHAVTFNLFEIIDEADILGSANVTAGRYTQIRMDVTGVEGLTSDNTTYIATVPSGKLKIVKPFEVKDGVKTILTLDFDGDKSLMIAGAGKALFKPVVKLLIKYEELPE